MEFFREVDDCSVCPFEWGGKYSECCCHSHPDGYKPCWDMDKYGDMTIEEVIDAVESRLYAAQLHWEEESEKKWVAQEKKKASQEKRRQTEFENYSLNKELTRLRRGIRKRKEFLSFVGSFATALSFTNQIMNNEELKKPEKKEKHPYELEIERMEKRIEEILLEKKKRAKERMKRVKNE